MSTFMRLVLLVAGCWLAGFLVSCSTHSGNKGALLKKKHSTDGRSDVQHAVASSLSREATVEALKYKTFQLARADFGYATDQSNVIVAEITQGSGVAYVSWIVLYKSEGSKWHAFGEPSRTTLDDVAKQVYIKNANGSKVFEVVFPSRNVSIKLPLPGSP